MYQPEDVVRSNRFTEGAAVRAEVTPPLRATSSPQRHEQRDLVEDDREAEPRAGRAHRGWMRSTGAPRQIYGKNVKSTQSQLLSLALSLSLSSSSLSTQSQLLSLPRSVLI